MKKTLVRYLCKVIIEHNPEDDFEALVGFKKSDLEAQCVRVDVNPSDVISEKVRWDDLRCEEYGMMIGEKMFPCNRPATTIVWSNSDRRALAMCEMCGDHSVRNRGFVLFAEKK